jgi:ribA/ribD-fused uncharacterized protein
MRITDTHIYFWGGEYSQWYKSNFTVFINETIGWVEFNTAEQYMMFMKAFTFGDFETMKKLQFMSDPKECKKLGRQVKNFNEKEWDKVKFDIVVNGNIQKFHQNFMLFDKMRFTGNKTFVEGSPYDKIWGVGIKWDDDRILDEKNWQGQNLLGKALGEARKMLMKLGSPKGTRNFKNRLV